MKTKARTDVVAPGSENEDVKGYLKQSYVRLVIPETDGTYRAELLEFPGCIAIGENPAEALEHLEEAAKSWLLSAIEQKQNIPRPAETGGFSGKLVLRIPKGLHKKASLVAEREGVSLNHFIACALAETVGEKAKTPSISAPQAMINFFSSGANQLVNFTSQNLQDWSGNHAMLSTPLIEA